MAFQFETLVGHLFIVNGRVLSTPPPGALVQVAPKKASRGREADTVYLMTTPSGDVGPSSFYEEITELAAERYFNSTGSVTAGLRAVYDAVNRRVVDNNRSVTTGNYEVNMLCAVLHDRNLYLSRCGLGIAALKRESDMVLFPTDPLDRNEITFGPPLGVTNVPDVKMKQYTISEGFRLVLSDAELSEADPQNIARALVGGDIGDTLVHLKGLVVEQASMMVLEFVLPDSQVPLLVREGDNSKEIARSPLPPEKSLDNVNVSPGIGTRVIDAATATRDRAQAGMGTISKTAGKAVDTTNTAVEHYFGDDSKKPRWWTTPVAWGIVIGIPLIIVVAVLVAWQGGIGESLWDICVSDSLDVAEVARGIDPRDVNGTVAAWSAVLLKVNECEQYQPEGVPDFTTSNLRREAQDIVDRLLRVDRRESIALVSFPSAVLERAVLRGLNLYVLDGENHIVYETQLESDGRSIVQGRQVPIASMRRGATVNQFVLDEIIDITWSEDGSGLSQSNVLVALDRNGVLVEYSPTIPSRGVQQLIGTENWSNPISMKIWRGNVYLLDPDNNQIWRYSPVGGTYSAAPTEYFAGSSRPDLRAAVDFDIDTNGAVFVLYSDGRVGKYVSGQVQDFDYANFPSGQELGIANAMYLSTSPIQPGLFVASRPNRTIYEVTQAGTFIASYRTYEEEQFASLSSIVADPAQRMVYALSGNTIFAFSQDD